MYIYMRAAEMERGLLIARFSKQFPNNFHAVSRAAYRKVYYFLIRRIIDLIEERKKRGVSFVGDILGQNFEESRRSGNWNELE